MVLYKCIHCNFSTTLKANYNRHINTKKHRVNAGIDENYSSSDGANEQNEHKKSTNEHKMSTNEHNEHKMSTKKSLEYSCDYCNKLFATKANKRRHELHFCKENVTSKDMKIRKLEKEKKKLEKKIDKLLDKVGNVTNNTNNNTNNIIVVNNYGKENTNYLTVDKIKALLDKPFDSVQELIKMLHFDSEHPENHNIKITNKKQPYVKIRKNDKWELKDKKETLENLVDDKYNILEDHYVEKTEEINVMNNFIDKYQSNYDLQKELQKKTEIVILNNS